MIAKLTGTVDTVADGHVILDVRGVGYLVSASPRTLDRIGRRGDEASLWIETQVREDAITLFGFADRADQDLFNLLTSVQGVGAKVALAIQAVLDNAALQTAIAAQDKTAVARANGVGPKLAARIVNELKDKVAGLAFAPKGVQAASMEGPAAPAAADAGLLGDVASALVNLGYSPTDAHGAAARAINKAGDDVGLGALIPLALKELTQ